MGCGSSTAAPPKVGDAPEKAYTAPEPEKAPVKEAPALLANLKERTDAPAGSVRPGGGGAGGPAQAPEGPGALRTEESTFLRGDSAGSELMRRSSIRWTLHDDGEESTDWANMRKTVGQSMCDPKDIEPLPPVEMTMQARPALCTL